MTKAERIYNDTKMECRQHIRAWGYMTNPDGTACGFNRPAYGDDEHICTRTLNDLDKLLAADRRRIDFDKRHGFWNEEKDTLKEQTLNMVETTLRNARRALAEW